MTAAGRALLDDYPGLAGLEYGKTGEPIVVAIEAEAQAEARAEVMSVLRDLFPGNDVDAVEDALREKGAA